MGCKNVSQVTSSDLLQVRLRKLLGAGGTVSLSFNVDDLDVEPELEVSNPRQMDHSYCFFLFPPYTKTSRNLFQGSPSQHSRFTSAADLGFTQITNQGKGRAYHL